VGERALVGEAYLADAQLRREYESEIAPRTVAALEWIFAATTLPSPRRVLDLGAGTGAASQTIRTRWPSAEIVAVDKVPGPGILRADVTRALRPPAVTGRFDLIVAAHLLNELSLDVDARARLVLGWCREVLEEHGTCVLVEPALRETSRGLLAVRDRLIAGGLFVLAPCLWQGPCPALARERDFCHMSAGVIAQGRSRVDFSYLALRTQGTPNADNSVFRMVSDPMAACVSTPADRPAACSSRASTAIDRLAISCLTRSNAAPWSASRAQPCGRMVFAAGRTARSRGCRRNFIAAS
jgi:ribosomal protein RSM22 (predicted rRNA methylase)